MAATSLDPQRQEFQTRILVQLRARYPAWEFRAVEDGFAISGSRDRLAVSFSLTTLHQSVTRPGAEVPQEISRFVAAAASRLAGAEEGATGGEWAPDPDTLVWCVRTERVIRRYPRADELLTRALPAGLLAFVAEALPGEVMRGVSRLEAERAGLGETQLAARAGHNTRVRLDRWRERLAVPPPHGRWLFTEDVLFSSSLLLVPDFLRSVAEKGGGAACLLVPDRGVLVAAAGDGADPDQLRHIGRRLYGRATSPLIPQLLATDGSEIALHPSERAPRRPWTGWRQVVGR
ncbi:MAG: hypothetical protein ACYCUD_11490 [Candidatus Dormibacteria bacterium]